MSRTRRADRRGKLFIESLETRRLLAVPGSLDNTFSQDSILSRDGTALILTPIPVSLKSHDVAVQPADGKTVVVGTAENFNTGEIQMAAARFNANGTQDTTFGDGGVALFQPSNQRFAQANAVAIAPDGKIVVIGDAAIDDLFDESELVVLRYNPDGTFDNTFAGDGRIRLDLSDMNTDTFGYDVAVRGDGSIVVVGKARHGGGTDDDFFIQSLAANGANQGVLYYGFFEDEGANAVKIGADGAVYVAGDIDSYGFSPVTKTGLVKRTPGGAPGDFQSVFQLPGSNETNVEDMILQGGKMVIAGDTVSTDGRRDFFIARFKEDGTRDFSFGGGGVGFRIDDLGGDDRVGGMTVTPAGGGGGFIVSGRTTSALVAVKYTVDGLLDTSFGVGGIAKVGVASATPDPANIAAGPGRRVVLTSGPNFFTARLLLEGAKGVNAGTLDSLAIEGTTNTGSIFVSRTERLPFPTRVFFSISGTTTVSNTRTAPRDYSMSGMAISSVLTPTLASGYVDIPANETIVVLTLTTINDSLREGNESATFSIVSNSQYEAGSPSSGTITIRDDDTPSSDLGTTTAAIPPKQVGVAQELQAAVTWTVPSGGWRQLSSIQLRLRNWHDDGDLAILTFDEATNSFSVESTGDNPVRLVLSKCTFQAAGPDAPTVTVIFTFRFNAAAANRRFRLDVGATDDAGNFSGFAQIGELHVHKKPKGPPL